MTTAGTIRNLAMATTAALLAAGCASPQGWTRAPDGARYAPTDPEAVQVVTSMPPGSEVLGQVHGVDRYGSARAAARRRAAELGADAIFVLAVGDEESHWLYDPWPIQFVEANALRLPR